MGLFDSLQDYTGLGQVYKMATGQQSGLGDFLGLGANPQANLPFQQDQANLIKALQDKMSGTAPSLANMQTQINGQNALANTMSAIHSSPGLNAALQARLGSQASQNTQSNIAQMGTLNKLAEQQAAEQSLGQQIANAQNASLGVQKMNNDSFNNEQERKQKLFSGIGTALAAGGA